MKKNMQNCSGSSTALVLSKSHFNICHLVNVLKQDKMYLSKTVISNTIYASQTIDFILAAMTNLNKSEETGNQLINTNLFFNNSFI